MEIKLWFETDKASLELSSQGQVGRQVPAVLHCWTLVD